MGDRSRAEDRSEAFDSLSEVEDLVRGARLAMGGDLPDYIAVELLVDRARELLARQAFERLAEEARQRIIAGALASARTVVHEDQATVDVEPR